MTSATKAGSRTIAKNLVSDELAPSTRARRLASMPMADRGEAWLDEAWTVADQLRCAARDDLAERLEDQCERVELAADGTRIPRQRRSDARGPPGEVACMIARSLRAGDDLDRACLYAGITVERHRSWMRHAGYASDFSSVG